MTLEAGRSAPQVMSSCGKCDGERTALRGVTLDHQGVYEKMSSYQQIGWSPSILAGNTIDGRNRLDFKSIKKNNLSKALELFDRDESFRDFVWAMKDTDLYLTHRTGEFGYKYIIENKKILSYKQRIVQQLKNLPNDSSSGPKAEDVENVKESVLNDRVPFMQEKADARPASEQWLKLHADYSEGKLTASQEILLEKFYGFGGVNGVYANTTPFHGFAFKNTDFVFTTPVFARKGTSRDVVLNSIKDKLLHSTKQKIEGEALDIVGLNMIVLRDDTLDRKWFTVHDWYIEYKICDEIDPALTLKCRNLSTDSKILEASYLFYKEISRKTPEVRDGVLSEFDRSGVMNMGYTDFDLALSKTNPGYRDKYKYDYFDVELKYHKKISFKLEENIVDNDAGVKIIYGEKLQSGHTCMSGVAPQSKTVP